MAAPSSDTTTGVLPKNLGGGPHGLGDPDDKSLRKVEREIMVAKLMRDKSKTDKCADYVKEFEYCCKENGLLMIVKCRKENTQLQDCLTKWYKDDDFRKECTKEYLEQRSEYRRTGIKQKQKKYLS